MKRNQVSWVYFVLCANSHIYTGVATDPIKRFERHKRGNGARSMRLARPIEVLGALPFASRREALQAEYAIKRMSRRQKLVVVKAAWAHPAWKRARRLGSIEHSNG